MTDAHVPDADDADLQEQATPIEERPALEVDRLQDPLVEANEADLLGQSQSVPADPDERR